MQDIGGPQLADDDAPNSREDAERELERITAEFEQARKVR